MPSWSPKYVATKSVVKSSEKNPATALWEKNGSEEQLIKGKEGKKINK